MTFLNCRFRPNAIFAALMGALALFALLTPAGADTASDPAGYRSIPSSADGIGKIYYGREIARVMGFSGASWLERPEREAEERPDWLVEELHLQPTMTLADIGAGSGYLTRRLAVQVPQGHVYAVDVQPEMVGLLKQVAADPRYTNVIPVQGKPNDVELPPSSIDLAIMVDVYHELEFPREVMQSIIRALKPRGRVVFVEYRGEDPNVPIKSQHKMTERQVRREMADLPLDFERDSERLPLQHILVFRRR